MEVAGLALPFEPFAVAQAIFAVDPLDFVRLVLMTGFGLVFFGESLSLSLGLGMLLVVGTTIYTVRANNSGSPMPERSA